MLSKENIQSLHKWTKIQGVEYYDVQLEIVDHLATSLEAQMSKNPNQDLQAVFDHEIRFWSKDKITKLIKEKNHHLYWSWTKKIWRLISEYFRLPKVIIWITLSVVIYYSVLLYGNFEVTSTTFYKVNLWTFLGYSILRVFKIERIFYFRKPRLLTVKAFFDTAIFVFLPVDFVVIFLNSTNYTFIADHINMVHSVVMGFMLIIAHAIIIELPKKLRTETSEYYKHLKLS